MVYPSKLIENAVDSLSMLPGIGKKTALRLILHILKSDKSKMNAIPMSLEKMINEIAYCIKCNNISDQSLCQICASSVRDASTICVVADIRDVLALENTGIFKGLYHVLGGLIAPLDGIGPDKIAIEGLIDRIKNEKPVEVILALNPTLEGDTTSFYIAKQLKDLPTKITTLAKGIAIGGELEYADELTLARSMVNRVVFQ